MKKVGLCYPASADNYICYKKCLAWFLKIYVNLLLTRSTKRMSSLVLKFTYYICLNCWSAWVCNLFSFPWKKWILKQRSWMNTNSKISLNFIWIIFHFFLISFHKHFRNSLIPFNLWKDRKFKKINVVQNL